MSTDIFIYCPTGEEGAARGDLEDDLEGFLGAAGELTGGGSGVKGYHLGLSLADGEDVKLWIVRLQDFLRRAGVRRGTYFEVYPDNWAPGQPWRRIEVFGGETVMTKRPT
jgi:hypothetical protein